MRELGMLHRHMKENPVHRIYHTLFRPNSFEAGTQYITITKTFAGGYSNSEISVNDVNGNEIIGVAEQTTERWNAPRYHPHQISIKQKSQ